MIASPVRSRSRLLNRTALCGAFMGGALAGAFGFGGGALALPFPISTQNSAEGTAPTFANPGSEELNVQLNAERTLIDWRLFDIESNETVRFFFQGRDGIVLNRTFRSTIEGTLLGTVGAGGPTGGNIWIVAPGGVIIGRGARISTGGLLATTAELGSDEDFLDTGRLDFQFVNGMDSPAGVDVLTGAQITGDGGVLALIAPRVTTGTSAQIGGPKATPGQADVLYGGASAFTVTFQRSAANDLDLFDFVIPNAAAGSSNGNPLTLGAQTRAGDIFIAAVSQASIVNSVIQAPGQLIATRAGVVDGNIVLSAGGGIEGRAPAAATAGGAEMAIRLGSATAGPRAQGGIIGLATGALQADLLTAQRGDISIAAESVTGLTGGAASDYIAGRDLFLEATNGAVRLTSATSGRDVSLTANNGDVSLLNATLERSFTARTTGFGNVLVGAATGGALADSFISGATGGTLDSVDAARVDVTGDLDLDAVTAGQEVAITATGAAALGDIAAVDGIFVDVGGALDVGSATTTALLEEPSTDGPVPPDVRLYGASVTLGSANSSGDVIVRARTGDVVSGAVTAADDVIMRADAGSVSLEGATLTGTAGSGDFESDPLLDADGNGHVLRLTAVGANGDVRLGLGTGSVVGGTEQTIRASRNAVVDLVGDTELTLVEGANSATVTVDGDLTLERLASLGTIDLDVSGAAELGFVGRIFFDSGAPPPPDIDLTAASLTVQEIDGADVNVLATGLGGADVVLANATVDFVLQAPDGPATIDTVSVGRDLIVSARTVSLGGIDGVVGRDLSLTATAGDLDAPGSGGLAAGRNLMLDASGAVTAGDLNAQTGDLSVTGATVDAGDLLAGLGVTVLGDGAVALGDVTASGGDAVLTGGSLSVGAVSASGSVLATATGGDAELESAAADEDVIVLAALGAADVGLASAGRDVTVSARTVSLGGIDGEVGRDLTLTATAGDLTAPGSGELAAGRSVALSASGALTAADVTARTGSASLAGATIAAGDVQAGTAVDIASTGAATLGDVTADAGDLTIAAGSLEAGDLTSGGALLSVAVHGDAGIGDVTAEAGEVSLTAGSLVAGTVLAGGNATVAGTGAVQVADVTSQSGDLTITAGSLQAGDLTSGGALLSVAIDGDANVGDVAADAGEVSLAAGSLIAGTVLAGADATIAATGTVEVADVTAGRNLALSGGTLLAGALDAGGTATATATSGGASITSVVAGSGAELRADAGTLTLGSADVGGTLVLAAAEVDAGDLAATEDVQVVSPGAVTVGAVTAGRDATLTGASLETGRLDARRDLALSATGGDFTAGDALSAGRDLSVSASGDLVLTDGEAETGALTAVAGGDLQAGTLTAATALLADAGGLASLGGVQAQTATLRATDLALIGPVAADAVTIESRTGDLGLGGGTSVGGLTLDAAELARIQSDSLTLYAGLAAGGATGDLEVGTADLDPARIGALTLLAGAGQEVRVSGTFAPTANGGVLTVGDGGDWTPDAVLITGGLGAGSTTAPAEVRAFQSVTLRARQAVLMGSPDFIAAVREAETVNGALDQPDTSLPSGYANRVFVAAQSLSLSAGDRIVQQNTGGPAGFGGLVLTNAPAGSRPDTVLTVGGGEELAVVDLFGSLVDRDGRLIVGRTAALAAPAVALADGTSPRGTYRLNGCILFSVGDCQSPNLTPFTVLNFRPDLAAETVALTYEDPEDEEEVDPDVTGAGSEEIWRRRP